MFDSAGILLYRNHQRTHDTGAPVNHHIRACDIAAEPGRQKAGDSAHLSWPARPLKPNVVLLRRLILQHRGRELRVIRHAPRVEPVQTHAHINLARADGIDADTRTLQHRNARPYHSQRRVAAHGIAWAPAPAVGASCAAHDNDAAVALILGCGVGIVTLRGCLLHRVWRVLQREERREAVCFEAFLQVARRREVDGRRAEEAGRAHPDIETAPSVESLVDQCQRILLRGDRVGIVDYFGVGVQLWESRLEPRWLIGSCARVDAGCAVSCKQEEMSVSDNFLCLVFHTSQLRDNRRTHGHVRPSYHTDEAM